MLGFKGRMNDYQNRENLLHGIGKRQEVEVAMHRLMKLRVTTDTKDRSESPPSLERPPASISAVENKQWDAVWERELIRSLVKKLLKRGKLKEYENVLRKKSEDTNCVTIPRSADGRAQVSQRKCHPHVCYPRMFRFPTLVSAHQLKPVPGCNYPFTRRLDEVCVNPYHLEFSPCGDNTNPRRPKKGPPSPLDLRAPLSPMDDQHQQYRSNYVVSPLEFPDVLNDQPLFTGDAPSVFMDSPSACYNNEDWNNDMTRDSAEVPTLDPDIAQSFADAMDMIEDDEQNGTLRVRVPSPNYRDVVAAQHRLRELVAEYPEARLRSAYPVFEQAGVDKTEPGSVVPDYWIQFNYYEYANRLGDPFKVSTMKFTIDGLTAMSTDDRFCLGSLDHNSRAVTVVTCRRPGITIERKPDGRVFLSVLSTSPVFVQAPLMATLKSDHATTVYRVGPSESIEIYNEAQFDQVVLEAISKGYSYVFVKGWGASYKRQTVTNTPCWIELNFVRQLQKLDKLHMNDVWIPSYSISISF